MKFARIGTCLALAGVLAATSANSTRAEDVNVSIPAVSILYVYMDVADKMGYWKEQGLNVKPMMAAGVAATNVVLSGAAEMGHNVGSTVIRANARGGDLVIIANTQERLLLQIVLRKDVAEKLSAFKNKPLQERSAALKGLTFAVNAPNAIAEQFLNFTIAKAGLKPGIDVTVSPMEPSAMVVALENKRVDGIVYSPPFTSTVVRNGTAVNWINASDGESPELTPFTYNTVVTKKGYCDRQPVICQKFLLGLNKALAFMNAEPEKTIAIARERFNTIDPEVVADGVRELLKGTPRTGKTDVKALENAQNQARVAGLLKEEEVSKNVAEFIDNRYVEQNVPK